MSRRKTKRKDAERCHAQKSMPRIAARLRYLLPRDVRKAQ